ncbi:MAG: FHA domain-containing protein [Chloroflexi bacterium]|nr:FHA domain-containing protein [Chloroflexota bacterium]
MPNPYIDGTFFWYWYEWTLPVVVAVVALTIAVGIVITTDRRPYGTIIRTLVILCVVGTAPLAEERIGIGISATEEGMAAISLIGSLGAIILGVFHFGVARRLGFAQEASVPAVAPTFTPAPQSPALSAYPSTGAPNPARRDIDPQITMMGQPDGASPAWLVFQSGPNAGQTTAIGQETMIGRAQNNDVVLDDEKVGPEHASITLIDGQYQLSEIGDASGTLVGGLPADSSATLVSGSTVRIGDTDILFMQGEAQPSPPSEDPRSDPDLTIGDPGKTIVAQSRPAESNGWLAVTEGPARGSMTPITAGEIRIGRADTNDLVIDDGLVSRHHAILVTSLSGMRISDLASSGGTLVNGEPLNPTSLSLSSVIAVGDTELVFDDGDPEGDASSAESSAATIVGGNPLSLSSGVLKVQKGVDAGMTFELREGDNVIGRGDEAVALSDPSISRGHAVIRRSGDNFIISDLGSLAGTLVDGDRVMGTAINNGDVITLGQTKIIVMGPQAE